MKKIALLIVLFVLVLVGYDVYEYLWSRYGVLPMRKL